MKPLNFNDKSGGPRMYKNYEFHHVKRKDDYLSVGKPVRAGFKISQEEITKALKLGYHVPKKGKNNVLEKERKKRV